MMNKGTSAKKLDILNLFYSLGAVVILLGVIAKLLEWEVQDIFMTVGLTMEAIVFGVSSIKYINKDQHLEKTEFVIDNQFHHEENAVESFESEKINDQLIHSYVLPQTFQPEIAPQNSSISFPQTDSIYQVSVPAEQIAPDLLWQLDKLGIISFPKDIFYQPEWIGLKEEEYTMVSQLFLDLFGKKVVPQKNIPLLKSYDIRLPESGIGELTIENPTALTNDALKVLLMAFKPYRYKGFFDQFVLYTDNNVNYIRSANANEIQVYVGEMGALNNYCKQFHANELIVSPALDFLAPFIKLKNEILLDYIIKRFDKNNWKAYELMVHILFDKNDPTKIFFLDKLKSVEYVSDDQNSILIVQNIIQLLAGFSNKNVASDILGKLLIIPQQGMRDFKLEERLKVSALKIAVSEGKYFELNDLFDSVYLKNSEAFNQLLEKLIALKFISNDIILELFNANKEDSVKEIFNKYTNYINKYQVTPSTLQLEFALLSKQILNK
jgi:hypothetical protein